MELESLALVDADVRRPVPLDAMQYSPRELIELAAVDSLFYSKTFFPNTFRQPFAPFHSRIWDLLDGPEFQYVGLEVFRGSGKTSIVRANISKRVAYGISRTILPVSASLSHASRTVRWLKKQVEVNHRWTSTFKLRKGKKWSDEEIEIINETAGFSIFILAVGILGQVRGVNIEDYRPDFIVADDPCDEENSGTEEQREKTAGLFFGALAPSLAPRSEVPWSKMALLATGLANGPDSKDRDLINIAHNDPEWHTVKFPILTEEKESVWPQRWPTKEVLSKKRAYTERGQLHFWMREYECSIISPEQAPLKIEWLRFYNYLPESLLVYGGLDPARAKSQEPHKLAISFIGVDTRTKNIYLLESWAQKKVSPDEAWIQFYQMAMRWRPYMMAVESIAFQQMLAWYFKKKMGEIGTFWNIRELEDKRKKRDRIVQEIAGPAANGKLWVNADMTEWIGQYQNWRITDDSDLLDSTAMAIAISGNFLLLSGDEGEEEAVLPILDERNIPDLPLLGGCP